MTSNTPSAATTSAAAPTPAAAASSASATSYWAATLPAPPVPFAHSPPDALVQSLIRQALVDLVLAKRARRLRRGGRRCAVDRLAARRQELAAGHVPAGQGAAEDEQAGRLAEGNWGG